MTTKKELRAEIDRLRTAADADRAGRRQRDERAYQEFTDAIASIPEAKDRKIRIIMPNGTILRALVAEAKVDRNMIDVGDGQMVSGLMDVTLILHPEPNR